MGRGWRFFWGIVFFSLCATQSLGALQCASSLLLGATVDTAAKQIQFRVYSKNATGLDVLLFADPHGQSKLQRRMKRDTATDVWLATVSFHDMKAAGLKTGANLADPFPYPFYAYRAYGPNWKRGADVGADYDDKGNRFNPNKALLDPYAFEVSHDPRTLPSDDEDVFHTGAHREESSEERAPKGIILPFPVAAAGKPIERAFKDEVIYELHVRGMTMLAPGIPAAERGTFAGLKKTIPYLKELGVTAVELLPVFEFQDDANQEKTTDGNNYWGYDPMTFFAPNRRFATTANQKRAGGVVAEFREMAEALRAEGIKLYLDVVYNHTAEGGNQSDSKKAKILSWRGLDNSTYYQTGANGGFQDNTGCGANFNMANPHARKHVLDSLRYWIHLGVSGFRFDLASVLVNKHSSGFDFDADQMDPNNVFNVALAEFGRPEQGGAGVDLIAEPWGVGPGTYQMGRFPIHPAKRAGMPEWNGPFRDILRRAENKWGVDSPTPGEMAARLSGSSDLFSPGLKGPSYSVNYVVSHDGPTLRDLNAFNASNNSQGYPYGPTDGGDPNSLFWDHAERDDTPALRAQRQRQAARNMMGLTLLAYGGVPMLHAGDEDLRTQNGNNNAYKIDSPGTWFAWPAVAADIQDAIAEMRKSPFFVFTRNLIHFRRGLASFRPLKYATGHDHNGNGLRDLSWYQANGKSAEDRDLRDNEKGYMNDPWSGFLGMRIDAEEHGDKGLRSTYIAYNWSHRTLRMKLPPAAPGKQWYWQGDSDAEYEAIGNFLPLGKEKKLSDVVPSISELYPMRGRSFAVFVEK